MRVKDDSMRDEFRQTSLIPANFTITHCGTPGPKLTKIEGKTMNTTIPTVVLTIILNAAFAQAACESYEYAELKDMHKEDLNIKFCEYEADALAFQDEAVNIMRKGIRNQSDSAMQYLSMSKRCLREMERINRIFAAQRSGKRLPCQRK